MVYKYNASCPGTLLYSWTKTAIDCYSIGCNCSKCYLYRVYFSKNKYKCKMKNIVIELVRKFGVPKMTEVSD